jgi:putative NADH-flavin reductase
MQVTVFGATGRAGTLVEHECLRREWGVRALMRDPSAVLRHPSRDIVRGDARSPEDVGRALAGADAVLCCLGMDDIAVAATDFSESVRNIVSAMMSTGNRRLLAIGWAGVLAHPDGGHAGASEVVPYLVHVAAEHVRNHEALRNCSLDWTLMCPVFLKEDIPFGNVRYEFDGLPSGSNETGYADLAYTMVQLVTERDSHGKCVGIVSDRQMKCQCTNPTGFAIGR